MRVLAIDSSGLTASVAVVGDAQTVAEYTVNYKKTHSQTLLPMIDEIVKMTELDMSSVDAIAVAGGPGSFTGLRIGSATAKGLGLALDKPLIHVPTVDALAYSVYGWNGIICPMMDARRSQVYTGLYTFSGLTFQVLEEQMAIPVAELIDKLNNCGRPVVFLGDGVPVYQEMLEQGMEVPYSFAPSYMNRQRAAVVGALGIRLYQDGRYETAAQHRPDYLRVSQAERERAERERHAPVQVREMAIEDGAAVAEMEHQLFADAWGEKSVLETMEQDHTICLVAEKAGRMIGYALIYTAADEAEIARIGVVKDMQKQGTGTILLREVQQICASRGMTRLLLDVRESNAAARALYKKCGFCEDGVRRGFYDHPSEDGILMSREITPEA